MPYRGYYYTGNPEKEEGAVTAEHVPHPEKIPPL